MFVMAELHLPVRELRHGPKPQTSAGMEAPQRNRKTWRKGERLPTGRAKGADCLTGEWWAGRVESVEVQEQETNPVMQQHTCLLGHWLRWISEWMGREYTKYEIRGRNIYSPELNRNKPDIRDLRKKSNFIGAAGHLPPISSLPVARLACSRDKRKRCVFVRWRMGRAAQISADWFDYVLLN